MDGVEESSVLLYVMGFQKKPIYNSKCDEKELQLEPVIVKRGDCLEALFIAREARNEKEWKEWLETSEWVQNTLHLQMNTLVAVGEDGEACVNRLIENFLDEGLQKGAASASAMPRAMDEHFFDAFRIASNGKMHHQDGRDWRMSVPDYHDMRKSKIGLRLAIEQAWQRRFNLAAEIDATRDVLMLVDKLTPFKLSAPMNDGSIIYSICSPITTTSELNENSRMLMQFTPLFDWHDLHILEAREMEGLAEIDRLTCKLQQTEIVLERQRALLGLPEGGRKRFRSTMLC
jgi:hypothetical protein